MKNCIYVKKVDPAPFFSWGAPILYFCGNLDWRSHGIFWFFVPPTVQDIWYITLKVWGFTLRSARAVKGLYIRSCVHVSIWHHASKCNLLYLNLTKLYSLIAVNNSLLLDRFYLFVFVIYLLLFIKPFLILFFIFKFFCVASTFVEVTRHLAPELKNFLLKPN